MYILESSLFDRVQVQVTIKTFINFSTGRKKVLDKSRTSQHPSQQSVFLFILILFKEKTYKIFSKP